MVSTDVGRSSGRYLNVENPANRKGGGLAHEHGFLLDDGHFSSIDFPNANTTDAWKITDAGDVVGDWSDNGSPQSGSVHEYLLHAGEFRSIDLSDVLATSTRKVNLAGQFIGIYSNDKKLVDHAIATPGRERATAVNQIGGSLAGDKPAEPLAGDVSGLRHRLASRSTHSQDDGRRGRR
jgi:hypothetical protein